MNTRVCMNSIVVVLRSLHEPWLNFETNIRRIDFRPRWVNYAKAVNDPTQPWTTRNDFSKIQSDSNLNGCLNEKHKEPEYVNQTHTHDRDDRAEEDFRYTKP